MCNQIFIMKGYGLCELSEKKSELLITAGLFFIKELLPRHKTIEVEISIMKYLDNNAHGYSLRSTERLFIIELKNQRFEEMLITLAHEIVHIKQMIRKEYLCEDEAYEKEAQLYCKFNKRR